MTVESDNESVLCGFFFVFVFLSIRSSSLFFLRLWHHFFIVLGAIWGHFWWLFAYFEGPGVFLGRLRIRPGTELRFLLIFYRFWRAFGGTFWGRFRTFSVKKRSWQ